MARTQNEVGRRREDTTPAFAHRAAPFLVLFATLALTLSLSIYSANTAETREKVRFESLAMRARNSVDSRIRTQVLVLRAAATLFGRPDEATAADLRNFTERVTSLDGESDRPGIGFAMAFTPENYANRQTIWRTIGNIPVPPKPSESSVNIAMVEPATPNSMATIGVNVQDLPNRRATLQSAIDTAAPTATPPLSLLNGPSPSYTEEERRGFVIYVPVYEGGGIPATVPERREKILGFAFSPFRTAQFFERLTGRGLPPELSIDIFDGAPGEPGTPIFESAIRPARNQAEGMQQNYLMRICNREWTLRILPTETFSGQGSGRFVGLVPLLGTVIAGLLFSLSLAQRRAKEKADLDAKELAVEVEERAMAEAEIRRLNNGLEELVEERTRALRLANQELEAFVYSVSHDLRAPLRTIDGFSLALAEDYGDRLDEEAQDYIARVRRAAKRMDGLISDLLTLSRITRAELNWVNVDVTATATEIAADLVRNGLAGGTEPQFIIQPGMWAKADARLLVIGLENLLSNAVKFTKNNPHPRIELSCTDGVFCLKDNGVGFNPDFIAKLFMPFERLHSPKDFPGTGIGLATVQRIVQRHGGEIWADAKEGEGATFWFCLEARPVQESVAVP